MGIAGQRQGGVGGGGGEGNQRRGDGKGRWEGEEVGG